MFSNDIILSVHFNLRVNTRFTQHQTSGYPWFTEPHAYCLHNRDRENQMENVFQKCQDFPWLIRKGFRVECCGYAIARSEVNLVETGVHGDAQVAAVQTSWSGGVLNNAQEEELLFVNWYILIGHPVCLHCMMITINTHWVKALLVPQVSFSRDRWTVSLRIGRSHSSINSTLGCIPGSARYSPLSWRACIEILASTRRTSECHQYMNSTFKVRLLSEHSVLFLLFLPRWLLAKFKKKNK